MVYYFQIQIFLIVFYSIESNSLETMEISSIMINFMSKSFSQSLTFCLWHKVKSFEQIAIPKAVCIVVPPMLIAATLVDASSKILGFCSKSLDLYFYTIKAFWGPYGLFWLNVTYQLQLHLIVESRYLFFTADDKCFKWSLAHLLYYIKYFMLFLD